MVNGTKSKVKTYGGIEIRIETEENRKYHIYDRVDYLIVWQ